MYRAGIILMLILVFTLMGLTPAGAEDAPRGLSGPYLGQKPPGTTPAVFASGFISTDAHEFSCTFYPDGSEFYFARGTGQYNRKTIMVTRLVKGAWTLPEKAFPDFPGESFEPHVTPDGKRIFFMGFMLEGSASGNRPDIDMFTAPREGDGWGVVERMGKPFNPAGSMFVSTTHDGTIYTTDAKKNDIARSVLEDGEYQAYENLGPPINTEGMEAYPYIAPDESFVIYCALSRESRDMLVSFRTAEDSWSTPKKIELGIPAGVPYVSPDGKYLFFVAGRPGDIHWVDMEIVNRLKP